MSRSSTRRHRRQRREAKRGHRLDQSTAPLAVPMSTTDTPTPTALHGKWWIIPQRWNAACSECASELPEGATAAYSHDGGRVICAGCSARCKILIPSKAMREATARSAAGERPAPKARWTTAPVEELL